jgi:hypothetical protein
VDRPKPPAITVTAASQLNKRIVDRGIALLLLCSLRDSSGRP